MPFQVHQDTVLWGSYIKRRNAAKPKEVAFANRNALHNKERELQLFLGNTKYLGKFSLSP